VSGSDLCAPSGAVSALNSLLRTSTRALLVVAHPWRHTLTHAGRAFGAPPNVTLFEVSPGGALDVQRLVDASRAAMKYILREEDRVSRNPPVRYSDTGLLLRVGMSLPPQMAESVGAETDTQGRVTRLGVARGGTRFLVGPTVAALMPPRVRWATLGPFRCSEMTPLDIRVSGLRVLSFRVASWLDCGSSRLRSLK